MSPLERRYRALLALFPPGYRARRGEELVGTLLDASPDDRRRPRPGDVVDLLRAAGRAWARVPRDPAARPAWRSGLAAGAGLLLLLQSAWAVLVATRLAVYGRGYSTEVALYAYDDAYGYGPGRRLAGVLFLLAWPAALGCLVRGRARAAARLSAAGTAAAAAWVLAEGVPNDAFLPLYVLVSFGALAATPLAVLFLLGPGARLPGRPAAWWAALGAACAAAAAIGPARIELGPGMLTDVIAPALGAVLAAVALAVLARGGPVARVATATVTLPLLGVATGTALDRMVFFDEPYPGPAADVGYVLGHWDFGLPLAVTACTWLVALYGVARSSESA